MAEQRKKVSARDVVADVRSGMSDTEMGLKYGFSQDGLQTVFEKLIVAGVLTKTDLDGRNKLIELDDRLNLEWDIPIATAIPGDTKVEDEPAASTIPKQTDQTTFKCPACNMPQPRDFKTCPQCGVLVDKFLKKKADEEKIATDRRKTSLRRRIAILIGVVGILAGGMAIGHWYKKIPVEHGNASQIAKVPVGTQVSAKNTSGSQNDPPEENIYFPVEFSEAEPQDTKIFLDKMIRALVIAGAPDLDLTSHPVETHQLTRVFNGKPPVLSKVIEGILEKEYGCSPQFARKGRDGESKDTRLASQIAYLLSAVYHTQIDPDGGGMMWKSKLKASTQYAQSEAKNAGIPSCENSIRELQDLTVNSIATGLKEKETFVQALRRREELRQAREAEARKHYAESIKSGKKPLESADDAVLKYDAIDGTEYVTNPPTSTPNEKRYVRLIGTIETETGNTVICYYGDIKHKWGFTAKNLGSYSPRINQYVTVIGKIQGVMKAKTVIGETIYMVVVDAVAVETPDGFFCSR